MEPILTRLLNFPGIVVENFRETETDLMLEVEAWIDKATCPRCSCLSSNLHQNHGYWVRDLPISNRQVRLKVNRRQFKCKTCNKPFSEDLEFVDRRSKYTNRLALEIVKQVRSSSVHSVAQNNELTDEEVWSMVKHISKKKSK
jgi:transposase